MVREWKEVIGGDGGGGNGESLSSIVFIFWGALVMLSLVTAIIFGCADGASKDKTPANHTDSYGAACAACGGGCGA